VLVVLGLGAHHLLYTDRRCIRIVYTYLPFMVLPLYARLTQLDPVLLEAAGDLAPRPSPRSARHPAAVAARHLAGLLLVFIRSGRIRHSDLLGGRSPMIGRVLWRILRQSRLPPGFAGVTLLVLL